MFDTYSHLLEKSSQQGECSISDLVDSRSATSAREVSEASDELPVTLTSFFSRSSPWVRAAELPELFSSWDLAYRSTKCGWLKPIVQGKRRTIYRLADVILCLQRIESGELPPPRSDRQGR